MEICEDVDNEETIRRFRGIREKMQLNRIWHVYLSNKLSKNLEKFGTIELAPRKIRSITGLQNITEVVEKFLTKENAYHELMNMIILHKGQKETLVQRNKDLKNKIEKILITEKPSHKGEGVHELSETIGKIISKSNYDKEREISMHCSKLKVENWLKRSIKVLRPGTEFGEENLYQLISLLKKFVLEDIKTVHNRPDVKVLKVMADKQIAEREKQGKLQFAVRLKQRANNSNGELQCSELNYADDTWDVKKKSYFVPLLEKALKKN